MCLVNHKCMTCEREGHLCLLKVTCEKHSVMISVSIPGEGKVQCILPTLQKESIPID